MKKISAIILTALLMLSCSTTKRVQRSQSVATDPSKQLLEQVVAVQPAFQSLQSGKARFKIDYSQHSYAVSGAISMIADSAIIISLQPLLGIELYRMEIMPQHLTVVDKMNRRYVRMTYTDVSRMIGVNLGYQDIQALLMNRVFAVGMSQSELLQKKIITSSTSTEHQLSFSDDMLAYDYTVDKQNLQLLLTRIVMPQKSAEVAVAYAGHRLFAETLFPEQIEISFSSDKLDATCQITLVQPVFNEKVNVAPANLGKYTATSLSNIIK